MTTGIKGTQGFPRTINPEDVKAVLTEKPMKNSAVLAELIKLNKRKYKNVTMCGVKKVLIKLGEAGEIAGGMDEDLGFYLWKMKEE